MQPALGARCFRFMTSLPRDPSPDSTLALLSEGYDFIGARCRRLNTDIFETRVMLRRAICVQGEEAARMFYEEGRFTRSGALPTTTLRLLQDEGSVATLDDAAHHHRKRMFMSMMTPASMEALVSHMEAAWLTALDRWQAMERVILLREAEEILLRAVCRWTGVPLPEEDARQRTRECSAMIEGAGSAGPAALRGLAMRRRTEGWLRDVVADIRVGAIDLPSGTPARVIATHCDACDRPLEPETAAVELLNLLRPTVAVSRYFAFLALALHEHPESRAWLAAGGEAEREMFVQEVRRTAPFFPIVAGIAREEFTWRGHRFDKGDWVMLDLYGTNRDARVWEDPDSFRPERFRGREISAFQLIPQGGGDFFAGHRCAGEWVTIALMKRALRLLTEHMTYTVPEQDLSVRLSRMPAQPASGFIMTQIRRAA